MKLIKTVFLEVSCGNHNANTCADCPQGNGASWCHGDCRWVDAGKFYSLETTFENFMKCNLGGRRVKNWYF